jgi:SAM-dependent methyltransferase
MNRVQLETAAPADTSEPMERVDCRACFSAKAAFFKELGPYRFQRCSECGLVYMSPRPATKKLEALYDESYFQSSDPKVGYSVYEGDKLSLRDKSSRLLDAIERHVAPGRFLDVGCAYGFSLQVARERGWLVEGIEPALRVAAQVQRELGVPVHRDLFAAGLPDRSFDAVALWDVIEHLPEPHQALVELRRILREGGCCSIVTPDLSSLAARLMGSRWEEMCKMPEHIYFFDRTSLQRLLERAGFVPLEWGTIGKLMPLEEAARRMIPTSPRLWKMVWLALRATGLDRKVVYLDPRWKISVVAKAT